MKKYWSREESKERFPLPITPLGWSLLIAPTQSTLDSLSDHMMLKKLSPDDMIKKINCYVYARKNFFKKGVLRKIRPLAWLKLLPLLALYFIRSKGRKFTFYQMMLEKFFAPKAEILLKEWSEIQFTLIHKMRQTLAGLETQTINYDEFMKLKSQMEQNSKEFFYHDFAVYFLKNIFYQGLQFSLKSVGQSNEEIKILLNQITQGLSENFSVQMVLDQKKLSSEEWLNKYGHLTDNWDVFAPTLSELFLQNQFSFNQNLTNQHEEKTSQRLNAEHKIKQVFKNNQTLVESLKLFQQLLLMDEEMRAYSSLQYPEIRILFKRVALTAHLNQEEIYFLTLEEIEHSLKINNFDLYRALIQPRQSEYHQAFQTKAPNDYEEDENNLRILESKSPSNPSSLCVSPGLAQGTALVVRSLEDLRDFSGSPILVLRSPTPTYAAYYSQCAGIISETGGALSHGAIVAREFQIPMISHVSQALEQIQTGDMIILDANLGHFEILKKV